MKFVPLLFIVLLCMTTPAHAEVKVGLAGGIVSAGAASGGFTPSASVAYSVRVSEMISLWVANHFDVTGLTYGNPGFVDRNVVGAGARWASADLDVGVSADVFNTVLCGMREQIFCNWVTGVSPGARASLTYYTQTILSGRLGVRAAIHGTWVVTGAIYNGLLGGADVGLVARIGAK